eukprot:8872032-Alexandrium_andersonii.AAC.1
MPSRMQACSQQVLGLFRGHHSREALMHHARGPSPQLNRHGAARAATMHLQLRASLRGASERSASRTLLWLRVLALEALASHEPPAA